MSKFYAKITYISDFSLNLFEFKKQAKMYKDDYARRDYSDHNSEDIYSKPVRAGKRTYFFDVKSTKGNNDFYLTITESKRKQEQDGSFTYDKHKIFLYKEDFDKFQEGLAETISYLKQNLLKEGENPDSSKESTDPFSDVKFEEL